MGGKKCARAVTDLTREVSYRTCDSALPFDHDSNLFGTMSKGWFQASESGERPLRNGWLPSQATVCEGLRLLEAGGLGCLAVLTGSKNVSAHQDKHTRPCTKPLSLGAWGGVRD